MFQHVTRVGKFRSKFEKSIADQLDNAGVQYEHEGLVLSYEDAWGKPHKYHLDFTLANGVLIETKGWFRPTDRTKHLLIKTQHPDTDIRFVFQRAASPIRKGSKTSNGQWATKNGFKWANKAIPNEWLIEK